MLNDPKYIIQELILTYANQRYETETHIDIYVYIYIYLKVHNRGLCKQRYSYLIDHGILNRVSNMFI